MLGIDVSNHQAAPDWKAVAQAGVRFVVVKASEGASFLDGMRGSHAAGARAAGLKVGFYHYARPDNNAPDVEARLFLEATRELGHDVIPALDFEHYAPGRSDADMVTWALAWLRTVEATLGRKPFLYTYPSFWQTACGNSARPAQEGYPLWLASYGPNDGGRHPASPVGGWKSIDVHQFTSKGAVAGFSGPVDLNYTADVGPYLMEKPMTVIASWFAPWLVWRWEGGTRPAEAPQTIPGEAWTAAELIQAARNRHAVKAAAEAVAPLRLELDQLHAQLADVRSTLEATRTDRDLAVQAADQAIVERDAAVSERDRARDELEDVRAIVAAALEPFQPFSVAYRQLVEAAAG